MELRILGPLEAVADGRIADIRGQKQRELLAILTIQANEVVSADRLIDELWGEIPPASAAKTLQTYVSRLRKALGEPAPLTTHGHGYSLALPTEKLDASRFAALLEDGRRALASGDPNVAAETLDAALALWRGPALVDFSYATWAQAEIARLEELRLAAREERVEADLALGRHAEAIGDLETLVSKNPFRERLRAQLMVALYRSGRHAEALQVYQEGRRALSDELGLEPSQSLQQLERRILEHDSTLAPAEIPSPKVAPAHTRSRLAVVVGAAVVGAVVAVAALAFAITRDPGGALSSVLPDSVGVIDPTTNRLVHQAAVGRRPDAVTVGEGSIWVANLDDMTISRIDPEDIQARPSTVAIDTYPSDLAVGNGAAWVALGARGAVLSVDTAYGAVSEPIPLLGESHCLFPHASVVLGGGFVWFTCDQNGLFRVNPRTGKQVPFSLLGGTIEGGTLSEYPDFVDIGYASGGSLWIVNRSGNAVIEADSVTSRERRTVTVGRAPVAIAVAGDVLWVANFDDDTVTRIDVPAGRPAVTTQIPVGDGPVGVAAAEDGVWVANQLGHTVSRIDPETNEVVATVDLGNEPGGVAAGAGSVWVTVRAAAPTGDES